MSNVARALISVSDKTGVVELAKGLSTRNVEILSTGGTAKAIREAGVAVRDVSEFTESPEIMDGRVKTLHPRVHGGILMRSSDADREALSSIGGAPIDLVVVNLYPFEQTVAKPDASHELIIENIDIGGPTMVRSAAKNHARVTVVVDPGDYGAVLEAIDAGGPDAAMRARLAAKAFGHTAAYDGAIVGYLTSVGEDGSRQHFPGTLSLTFDKAYDCRYGENPHQKGAFYVERGAPAGSLARAESLGAGGKELSFNNLVDIDATLDAVREFSERPAAVVVKHTNPCGVAVADELGDRLPHRARGGFALSAFGGIVAVNRAVDEATAKAVTETFIECVIAPVLSTRPPSRCCARRRTSASSRPASGSARTAASYTYKRVGGGIVVQDRDGTGAGEVRNGRSRHRARADRRGACRPGVRAGASAST